jgi:hypothetical protein
MRHGNQQRLGAGAKVERGFGAGKVHGFSP